MENKKYIPLSLKQWCSLLKRSLKVRKVVKEIGEDDNK